MKAILANAALLCLAGCATGSGLATLTDGSSLRAAHAALSEGEAATALGIAHGVLSVHPDDAAAMAAAGDADAALGNRRTAEGEYHQALAIAPGTERAALGLAKLQLAQNPGGAEAALEALLRTHPRDAAALTDLGVALDMQERHQAAQAQYDAALAADPNLVSARVDLAVSLALSGQAARAEGLLQDAAGDGNGAPKLRADFALAQVMAGHSDEALRTLRADLSADDARQSVVAMETLRPAH